MDFGEEPKIGYLEQIKCLIVDGKDFAGRSKIWLQIKGQHAISRGQETAIYKKAQSLIYQAAHRIYPVWQFTLGKLPYQVEKDRDPRAALFPFDLTSPVGEISTQQLLAHVKDNKLSRRHAWRHFLNRCPCQDTNLIAASMSWRFSLHTDDIGYVGDFDRFGPGERSFMKIKTLPYGGEASVCLVMKHAESQRVYVLKTVMRDLSLKDTPDGKISNEALILLDHLKSNIFPHPNIIEMHDCVRSMAVETMPLHVLQMEYCAGGDLHGLNERCVKHHRFVPLGFMKHIFQGLIEGLAYLHHGIWIGPDGAQMIARIREDPYTPWQAIVHNDLKPENILLRWPPLKLRDGATAPPGVIYPDIVIADFGTADLESQCIGPRGTYGWAAPEVQDAMDCEKNEINHFRFRDADRIANEIVCTTKSDIWGIGAIMYSLMLQQDFATYWKKGLATRMKDQNVLCDRYRLSNLEPDGKSLKDRYQKDFTSRKNPIVVWTMKCLGKEPFGRPDAKKLLELAVPELHERDQPDQELPDWLWQKD